MGSRPYQVSNNNYINKTILTSDINTLKNVKVTGQNTGCATLSQWNLHLPLRLCGYLRMNKYRHVWLLTYEQIPSRVATYV